MEWMMNELKNFAITAGIRLVAAVFVLVIGFKITSIITKKIKSSRTMAEADVSVVSFISSFISLGLRIALIFSVIAILGVPMSSMVALVASAGVAIGLAVQGALSNLVGGIMILMFKPFKVGDYIEAAGESGTVKDISVVYTVLITPDNKHITVPNGTLTNSVLKNYSTEENRRVDFTFDVAYGSDEERVKKIITDVIAAHPLAFSEPAPFVRLSSCADSSLKFVARVWCKNSDYWTVNFDVLEGVKKAFDENGISIPYPQLDVHIDK